MEETRSRRPWIDVIPNPRACMHLISIPPTQSRVNILLLTTCIEFMYIMETLTYPLREVNLAIIVIWKTSGCLPTLASGSTRLSDDRPKAINVTYQPAGTRHCNLLHTDVAFWPPQSSRRGQKGPLKSKDRGKKMSPIHHQTLYGFLPWGLG